MVAIKTKIDPNQFRGVWVDVGRWSYFCDRTSFGRARLREILRNKRADPVIVAIKAGRDVIDVRSEKPWHPSAVPAVRGE